MPLLEVVDLEAGYGQIRVLHGVSLHVERSEVVAVLGANGAGKSTTLLTVSGVVPVSAGTVRFGGEDITSLPGHLVARRGLAQVPEGRGVFPQMSVEENLVMGAIQERSKAVRRERLRRAYDLFPKLGERRRQNAGSLSGGEQQMLAISRALMAEPSMVMLDEPSLGLAPALVETMFETILTIREAGLGVLLVEQNAGEALEVSDRAYVMEQGAVVLSGPAAQVKANESVRAAYLGV
ncbi:ABC transporter ATP-binding protein [Streptosporangium violaceochromogenes]|nr:ABC transporter ATP-binding protein [Streptosporangium violaceochromogenes]